MKFRIPIWRGRATKTAPRDLNQSARATLRQIVGRYYIRHHLSLYPRAVSVFCQYVLKCSNIERLVGHNRLEPVVFVSELPQRLSSDTSRPPYLLPQL
jgi:hypothetical protein